MLLCIINQKLPKGKHFYKFIVDGQWKFNPEDPLDSDENGIFNNYIEVPQIKTQDNVLKLYDNEKINDDMKNNQNESDESENDDSEE